MTGNTPNRARTDYSAGRGNRGPKSQPPEPADLHDFGGQSAQIVRPTNPSWLPVISHQPFAVALVS
jgi:hypothetical protein